MANAEATTAVVEHAPAGGEHHVEPSALGLGPGAWVALSMLIFLGILVFKKVPAAITGGLDKQIAFDAAWETKVVDRILHNMSLLMDRSFKSVQELNRFRKEISAPLAGGSPAA